MATDDASLPLSNLTPRLNCCFEILGRHSDKFPWFTFADSKLWS